MEDNISVPHQDQIDFVELTADIVSAYVANNSVPVPDLPTLLSGVHAALTGLGQSTTPAEPDFKKATPAQIKKSVTPDALISFIDGKPYKTLKRHLAGNGLTMEEYRARFGLPRDYPSTAASYSALRSEMAHRNGLGQLRKKVAPKAAAPAEIISEKPKRAGRPRKAKDGAEA